MSVLDSAPIYDLGKRPQTPAQTTEPTNPESGEETPGFLSPDNPKTKTIAIAFICTGIIVVVTWMIHTFSGINPLDKTWYWLGFGAVAVVYGVRWVEKSTSLKPVVAIAKLIAYISILLFLLNVGWTVFVQSNEDFKNKPMNLKNFLGYVSQDKAPKNPGQGVAPLGSKSNPNVIKNAFYGIVIADGRPSEFYKIGSGNYIFQLGGDNFFLQLSSGRKITPTDLRKQNNHFNNEPFQIIPAGTTPVELGIRRI